MEVKDGELVYKQRVNGIDVIPFVEAELNRRFGLNLTDAFCGFKAYRREALEKFSESRSSQNSR